VSCSSSRAQVRRRRVVAQPYEGLLRRGADLYRGVDQLGHPAGLLILLGRAGTDLLPQRAVVRDGAFRLARLMRRLFVGVGTRRPRSVTFGIFEVQ
jgi:hypothetical protein